MRRHQLALLVLLMAALTVLISQPAVAQCVEGGVKGGASFGDMPKTRAFLTSDPEVAASGFGYRYGYLFGGFATFRVAGKLAFQPEVLYVQKGLYGIDPSGIYAFELRFDFIDVPLLARIHTGGARGVYVLAGPSVGFSINAREFSEGTDEVDIRSHIENSEITFIIGAGFQWAHALVEGRLAEGLTNLSLDRTRTYQTRTLAVIVGAKF